MNDQELLTQCYHRMYQGMIQKDSSLLAETLDDSFVLIHMTGMRQTKRQYMEAILNGTLNYFSEQTEGVQTSIQDNEAQFVGQSQVSAAVFGGGRHTWRLQLSMRAVKKNGQEKKSFCMLIWPMRFCLIRTRPLGKLPYTIKTSSKTIGGGGYTPPPFFGGAVK